MNRIKISDKLIKEVNRIFHEEEAKLYDERHPEIEREKENWNYVLGKYLPNMRKSFKVLDIGTGTGFVPSIVDKYLEKSLIICTDISKHMLQTAKMKLRSDNPQNCFEFVVCDAENLPFNDSSINIVTINSTLHHIPNYRKLLDEINRVLSKGGILFIMHEPNKLFYGSWMLSKINRICQLYLSFKSKFEKSKKRKIEETNLFERVNRRLINERIISEPLSQREIQSLVDVHSPTASGTPNRNKGFIPEEIASQLRSLSLLEMKTYNHLGKINPKKDIVCFLLNSLLAKIFKLKGYMFYIVLTKRQSYAYSWGDQEWQG